tara:strand:+ start:4788 stop:5663 length:876 start_codon:yes stop_codon:yes gene_type:complete
VNSELSYPVFLGSEIDNTSPDKALFHVLPMPFEESVSYGGGTRLGPSSILEASWQLETWDCKSTPSDCGIHTLDAIDCSGQPDEVIKRIVESVKATRQLGKIPVGIGGEHTVTLGTIQGMLAAGDKDFGIVQIDAHADLRDAYEDNPLSHASVMKRCVDLGIPLYQLGIRAFCEEERDLRNQHAQIWFQDAEELVPNNINAIKLPDNFPSKVFFTLDIDGMDPSIFPSTGTPVPGGLGWYQTLSLFESVAQQRKLIGFDLVEFAPIDGFHAYQFSAAMLLYKMMGIVQRNL